MSKLKTYLILFLIKIICVDLLLGASFGLAAVPLTDEEIRAMDEEISATPVPSSRPRRILRKKIVKKRNWRRNYLLAGELGTLATFPIKKQDEPNDNFEKSYLLLRGEYGFEPTATNPKAPSYLFSSAVRGVLDRQKDNEISVRNLTFSILQNWYRWDLGIQEIGWGETFGNYILDLVNPRDYRDPLLDDLSWMRVPVAAVNLKYFFSSTTLQLVLTPIPRSNKYPRRGTYFDPFPAENTGVHVEYAENSAWDSSGRESEFGGRVSHLFDNGLDLGFIYYNYWNRNSIFVLDDDGIIRPKQKRMQTYGFSTSQAFEQIVLRADLAFHQTQLTQYADLAAPNPESVTQVILGTDMSFRDNLIFGLQWQKDIYRQENLQWGSARIEKVWWKSRLKSEIFVFQGLGNKDFWLQPRQTWNATDNLSFSLSADLVQGNSETVHTYMNSLVEKDRYLGSLSYKF